MSSRISISIAGGGIRGSVRSIVTIPRASSRLTVIVTPSVCSLHATTLVLLVPPKPPHRRSGRRRPLAALEGVGLGGPDDLPPLRPSARPRRHPAPEEGRADLALGHVPDANARHARRHGARVGATGR